MALKDYPVFNIKLLQLLFVAMFLCFLSLEANALSEYGRSCDDNSDCTECRDEDLKCQACMNDCWNHYGPAEVSTTTSTRDKEEACRIKRAKWCNAQCWDPDDRQDPNYVSTKPQCSETRAFPKYRPGDKKPWE